MSNIHAIDDHGHDDVDPIDEEVATIAVIVDAMSALDPDEQARVLTYVNDRYSVPTRKTYSLAVRKLAAKTAAAASKKSGRPVDPRVQKLADF